MTDVTKPHEMQRSLREDVIVPGHEKRTESAEFRAAKERLKADGHHVCYVCGSPDDIQIHHYGCEWSLAGDCDFDKLKAFLLKWDAYGYSNLLQHQPLSSVDDVRNMMALCREHHVQADTGIHEVSFPVWIIQLIETKRGIAIPEEK